MLPLAKKHAAGCGHSLGAWGEGKGQSVAPKRRWPERPGIRGEQNTCRPVRVSRVSVAPWALAGTPVRALSFRR